MSICRTTMYHLHTQAPVPAVCRSLSHQNKPRLAGHAQLTRPRLDGLPGRSQIRFRILRGTPCALLRGAERQETLMRQSLDQSLKLHHPLKTSCGTLSIFSHIKKWLYLASF